MPRYVVTLTDDEIQERCIRRFSQYDCRHCKTLCYGRHGNCPQQENRCRKATGEVEARICTIACSAPPEDDSRWTMQAIADELIRLEVVEYHRQHGL